jgi:hypothetical protein
LAVEELKDHITVLLTREKKYGRNGSRNNWSFVIHGTPIINHHNVVDVPNI